MQEDLEMPLKGLSAGLSPPRRGFEEALEPLAGLDGCEDPCSGRARKGWRAGDSGLRWVRRCLG